MHSASSNGEKREEGNASPSDGVVTEEMIKEESDLFESSLQKNLAESSQVFVFLCISNQDECGLYP